MDRVIERLRDSRKHAEAERTPQRDRAFVRFDHGVELNRPEAPLPRPVNDVLSERPSGPVAAFPTNA
jgi:hypothetical protein